MAISMCGGKWLLVIGLLVIGLLVTGYAKAGINKRGLPKFGQNYGSPRQKGILSRKTTISKHDFDI